MKKLYLIPILLASLSGFSQCPTLEESITTMFASNNGQDGVMFDVVTNTLSVELTCIEANVDVAANITVEVYKKIGTHVGFEANAAAWTLHTSTVVNSAGLNLATTIPLDSTLYIPCISTVGIYVAVVNNSVMNYTNGTTVGAIVSDDGVVAILEGTGKNYPFSSSYSPRVFNGTIKYNILTNCSMLPIELLEFNVNCNRAYWSTYSETNNDYFQLQMSFDAKSWIPSSRIDGAGNSNTIREYEISLFMESTMMYYRLMQVDFNGNYSYSEIKSNNCPQRKDNFDYYNSIGQKVNKSYRGYKFKIIKK